MWTKTEHTYYCDYCGEAFISEEVCRAHEETHLIDYKEAETEEIIAKLNYLAESAWSHHIFGKVMGMPCSNMASLLRTAAERLKESEGLK